jgi:CMP-N-acetylneuraminic acid synthetase
VFIPGRLSSERLPNKLILPLDNTNLWEIACDKLNNLPTQYNKYVLCYETELINIAKNFKNIKIIKRSKKTAEVDGPLTYIFKDLKTTQDSHLMFLNPCLSLLKLETIHHALDDFRESQFDYATSVKTYKNWLWNVNKKILTDIDYKTLNTKLIGDYYQAAHCFHIFNKTKFFKTGKMLRKNLQLIEVQDSETIDVDTNEDYLYVKWRFTNGK